MVVTTESIDIIINVSEKKDEYISEKLHEISKKNDAVLRACIAHMWD